MINYLFPCYDYNKEKESRDLFMELQVTKKAKFFCLAMALLMTLGIFISVGTSVYASDQLEDSEVEAVAKGLEEMYANGVTEDNFKNYVKNNFAKQEISSVEEELNVNISDASTVVQARFNWNALGSCVANKIKDEFFAMISISAIVKAAQKKAWKELAVTVLRFAKANGLKTNAIIVAGQLALWAVQCGLS